MRLLLAACLGGLVLFFWGFVANMLLPLGNLGYESPVAEDPVLTAMQANFPREGVYMLPNLTPEQYADPVASTSRRARTAWTWWKNFPCSWRPPCWPRP